VKAKDPQRAKTLRNEYYKSGSFGGMLDALKEYVKSSSLGTRIRTAKLAKLGFYRHYVGGGIAPKKVISMWARGVDEKGKRLRKCRDARGRFCYRVPEDDCVDRTHSKTYNVKASWGKKALRGDEGAAVLCSSETGKHDFATDSEDTDAEPSDLEPPASSAMEQLDGEGTKDGEEQAEEEIQTQPDVEAEDSDDDNDDVDDDDEGSEEEDDDDDDDGAGSKACDGRSKASKHSATPCSKASRKSKAFHPTPAKKKKLRVVNEEDSTKKKGRAAKVEKQAKVLKDECKELRAQINKGKDKYTKSAHLWPLQRAILNFNDKRLRCEVQDGKPLLEFLQIMLKNHGSDEQVAALDLQPTIELISNSTDALTQWNGKVKSWKFPVDFSKKRVELWDLVKSYKDACDEGRVHTEALSGLFADQKKVSPWRQTCGAKVGTKSAIGRRREACRVPSRKP